MARDLITAVKTTANSTATCKLTTSNSVLIATANGGYIKTGGASHIDASRLLFYVLRKSSKQKLTGASIRVRSGSTSGKEDFVPGSYSTANGLNISVTTSTQAGGQICRFQCFYLGHSARFKDTNGYINMDFSTAMGRNGNASENRFIGAIYLKP